MTAVPIDPLLQPSGLRHPRLRDRSIRTSHEPTCAGGRTPKLVSHGEAAGVGAVLTKIIGSANVIDSPSVAGQLYVGDDAVIPYPHELAGRGHAHGATVMSRITEMRRCIQWDDANTVIPMSATRTAKGRLTAQNYIEIGHRRAAGLGDRVLPTVHFSTTGTEPTRALQPRAAPLDGHRPPTRVYQGKIELWCIRRKTDRRIVVRSTSKRWLPSSPRNR